MKIKSQQLHVPFLEDVAEVFRRELSSKFESLKVEVVDSPNLQEPPFHLASSGLSGHPKLVDVGGVPYLLPLSNKEKVYDLVTVAKQIDLPNAFLIGAGAGPGHVVGTNCEMMANIKTGEDFRNETYIAKVKPDGKYELLKSPSTEFRFLGNIFASEGHPGKVIKVVAKKRLVETNFVSLMRTALAKEYGDKPVGMGGVFLIQQGEAKLHIMPDCSTSPLETDEDVNNWLKFYTMKAPLVCLSTFVSHDPGLDLRVEHTHCFSTHGDGGHYHNDTTPDTVEYVAFLNVAEAIYRIDPPAVTHLIGRD